MKDIFAKNSKRRREFTEIRRNSNIYAKKAKIYINSDKTAYIPTVTLKALSKNNGVCLYVYKGEGLLTVKAATDLYKILQKDGHEASVDI